MGFLSSLAESQKVVTLSPSATVAEAAEKMASNKIGSIVVTNNGQILGIFTERDLLNRVVAKRLDVNKMQIQEVMSKQVETISVHETVQSCFSKMEKTKCRHLPIVDDAKHVVGMVTMRNILESLVKEIQEENGQLKKYIET